MKRSAWVCIVGGIIFELGAAFALWFEHSLLVIVLLHLAGSILWGAGIARTGALFSPQTFVPAAFTFILPGLGLLFALFFRKIEETAFKPTDEGHFMTWGTDVDFESSLPEQTTLSTHSIVKILQGHNVGLRRSSVLALRDLPPHLAIPLLRKALLDSDEQVRIYAQNLLAEILGGFDLGVKKLEHELAEHPGDVQRMLRLAEYYYELVYLNIASDDEAVAHYLGKALAVVGDAYSKAPKNRILITHALRYSLRLRDVGAAQIWLARLQSMESTRAAVLPYEIELAYLTRDWQRLRDLFDEFRNSHGANPRIDRLADFWLTPPAQAA